MRAIQVAPDMPLGSWVWGAFKMPAAVYHELALFWRGRAKRDEYVGTLINAWIGEGGSAIGVRAGRSYVDVGTLEGYRAAIHLLRGHPRTAPAQEHESG